MCCKQRLGFFCFGTDVCVPAAWSYVRVLPSQVPTIGPIGVAGAMAAFGTRVAVGAAVVGPAVAAGGGIGGMIGGLTGVIGEGSSQVVAAGCLRIIDNNVMTLLIRHNKFGQEFQPRHSISELQRDTPQLSSTTAMHAPPATATSTPIPCSCCLHGTNRQPLGGLGGDKRLPASK